MLYSLPPSGGYRLAGLKTLLLAPWSGAAVYSYATAALSHITNFSGLSGWEYVACEAAAPCEFGEGFARTLNGKTYPQTISVALAGLSAARRTAVEGLIEAGPVVALVEDFNNQWWLYGQNSGLRLLTAASRGGLPGAEHGLTLPLTGTQREAARTVSQSRINLLYNNATSFTLPE